MIFRILCMNKDKTDAYADLLERYDLLADGRVFCTSVDGCGYFAKRSEIMINPHIIHKSSTNLYKIFLDGYGIPETKRAGRSDEE